jgi:hypothetical protein
MAFDTLAGANTPTEGSNTVRRSDSELRTAGDHTAALDGNETVVDRPFE